MPTKPTPRTRQRLVRAAVFSAVRGFAAALGSAAAAIAMWWLRQQ